MVENYASFLMSLLYILSIIKEKNKDYMVPNGICINMSIIKEENCSLYAIWNYKPRRCCITQEIACLPCCLMLVIFLIFYFYFSLWGRTKEKRSSFCEGIRRRRRYVPWYIRVDDPWSSNQLGRTGTSTELMSRTLADLFISILVCHFTPSMQTRRINKLPFHGQDYWDLAFLSISCLFMSI